MKLFLLFLLLSPIALFSQKMNGCEEFPLWQKLMDKGKYKEAYDLAVKYTNDVRSEDVEESKQARRDRENYENFKKKYSPTGFCFDYFKVEAAYQMGNIELAVKEATRSFNPVSTYYKNDEPILASRYLHLTMELAEKQLAENKVEQAAETLNWVIQESKYEKNNCPGYLNRGKMLSHVDRLVEILGDVYTKRRDFQKAIKFYNIVDTTLFRSEILAKITTVNKLIEAEKNFTLALDKQKIVQQKEDENLLPKLFNQVQNRKVGLLEYGNISAKIAPATKFWADKKLLSYSESGEELFFRDPNLQFYQVWNLGSKLKTQEITSDQLTFTAKGREIAASFLPFDIIYTKADSTTTVWLNSKMNLSIFNRDKFTVSNEKNEAIYTFIIPKSKFGTYSDINNKLVETQVYFDQKNQKIFIIRNEPRSEYLKEIDFGIYCFDMNTNVALRLFNSDSQPGYNYSENKYWFSNNNLVLYSTYYKYTNFQFKNLRIFDLTNLRATELNNFNYPPLNEEIKKPWIDFPYRGTDQKKHNYFSTISSKDSLNTIDLKINYQFDKNLNIVSIYNGNNQNSDHYDIAVDPSGKFIAYINVFNHPVEKEYASICLYNVNEPDRLYTLNDQTKYNSIVAKNYVTNSETEAYLVNKISQSGLAKAQAKKDREAAENKARIEADLAMQKRKIQYAPILDSLKEESKKVKAKITAIYAKEVEQFNQGNYADILTDKIWELLPYTKSFYYEQSVIYLNKMRNYNLSDFITYSFTEQLKFKKTMNSKNLELENLTTFRLPKIDFIVLSESGDFTSRFITRDYTYAENKCKYNIDIGSGSKMIISKENAIYLNTFPESYFPYSNENNNAEDISQVLNDYKNKVSTETNKKYKIQNSFINDWKNYMWNGKGRYIELSTSLDHGSSLITYKYDGTDRKVFSAQSTNETYKGYEMAHNSLESKIEKIENFIKTGKKWD